MTTKEHREIFLKCGIPPRYIEGKLADVEGIASLIEYVLTPAFREDLMRGMGITFTGEDDKCQTVLYHLAKSVLVRELNCQVCTPLELQDALDDDESEIADADVLVLVQFTNGSFPQNPVHRAYEVEDLLLRSLNAGRAVIVAMDENPSAWWSERLLRRIEQTTRGMAIV